MLKPEASEASQRRTEALCCGRGSLPEHALRMLGLRASRRCQIPETQCPVMPLGVERGAVPPESEAAVEKGDCMGRVKTQGWWASLRTAVSLERETGAEYSRLIPPPHAHTTRSSTAFQLSSQAPPTCPPSFTISPPRPRPQGLLHHILSPVFHNVGSPVPLHTHTPPWTLSDPSCSPSSAAEAARQ